MVYRRRYGFKRRSYGNKRSLFRAKYRKIGRGRPQRLPSMSTRVGNFGLMVAALQGMIGDKGNPTLPTIPEEEEKVELDSKGNPKGTKYDAEGKVLYPAGMGFLLADD